MLTQSELKSQLHYDPETGIFTWHKDFYHKKVAGKVAGSMDKGYVRIRVNKKGYKAHRLVWLYIYGTWPAKEIDHINRIKHDNRLCNLREATHQQNQWNYSKPKNNTSGYIGVSMRGKSYVARIKVDRKKIKIGTFDTAEKAGQAYLSAKSVYHVI
jgi:hypothetical protein